MTTDQQKYHLIIMKTHKLTVWAWFKYPSISIYINYIMSSFKVPNTYINPVGSYIADMVNIDNIEIWPILTILKEIIRSIYYKTNILHYEKYINVLTNQIGVWSLIFMY